jgi:hypothetical protein
MNAAERVVEHLISRTKSVIDSGFRSRQLRIAQHLLQTHDEEQIISAINHTFLVKKINIYSLHFFTNTIDGILKEVRDKKIADAIREQQDSVAATHFGEVRIDEESAKRNRDRAERLGVQSRFGKKFNLDLLERPGEDH